LPVVANPIGVTPQLVVHGETGYLASTPDEWAEAITRLAENPALRRQMGAAGRRMVQHRYSVGVWAPRFAALVREAAESFSPAPAYVGGLRADRGSATVFAARVCAASDALNGEPEYARRPIAARVSPTAPDVSTLVAAPLHECPGSALNEHT
jgi:hypothetical protein